MKPTERDELLLRLDERSVNTWKAIEKLEKSQSTQNGIILETCKLSERNRTSIKNFKWVITAIGTFIVGIYGWFIARGG